MAGKYFRYTVAGAGYFPIDMLRYDSCWPSDDIAVMGISDRPETYPLPEQFYATKRRITLISHDHPTVRRWESFGWRVEGIKKG